MKVAILQCANVLEKFQPEFGDYNDMIHHMFDCVDEPVEFEKFDCHQGHFPDAGDSYDFYITTGSKAGVYEKDPWIQQLIEFIRHLYSQKKKLIGICFGHQLIAMACGGMVEKSAKGWGLGVAVNRIVASPEWMREKPPVLHILVSHQDQITILPDEALLIAESDFCPFFMVQWNDHFLSIQGHPEWNRAYARTLMNDRRATLPPEKVESGLSSLNIKPDNELFIRWIMDFVGRKVESE